MAQALYRKYRSKSFDEVVGQKHVTDTLKKAVASGKISHAYLFTGPRGVGKTSVARILAHQVNKLAIGGEAVHLDIIEIDAASNRRIDEIRELRERVHIAPASAVYKVYIIDEVHMLTKEAFNALLKTLEEPPAHVIFILATTEAHKLPETIISRTQRFSFKPITDEEIVKHLQRIAKKEGLELSDEALELIATHAEGSLRDSLSLLDQLSANAKEINDSSVRSLLGIPKSTSIKRIIKYIKEGRSAELIEAIDELWQQGINPAIVAKEIAQQLRSALVYGEKAPWLTKLLRNLLEVSVSAQPQDSLEISLLEAASGNHIKTTEKEPKTQTLPVRTSKSVSVQASPAVARAPLDQNSWPLVMDYIKRQNSALYRALRLSKPAFAEDFVTLIFEFPLHQKKVSQTQSNLALSTAIEEVTGTKAKIECVVDKRAFKSPPQEVAANKSQKIAKTAPVETISNIFGGAEVLES